MTGADEWRRPPPTRRQATVDVVIGLVLAAGAELSFELARSVGFTPADGPGRAEQVVWALALALPLCVRRRYPLPVAVVVAGAVIALQARQIGESLLASLCLLLAVYTAGAWARDRRAGAAVRTVVVVAMLCWLGIALAMTRRSGGFDGLAGDGLLAPAPALIIFFTATNVIYLAAAVAFGDLAYRAARGDHELRERNAELEVERTENARRAVVEERVRIARELHDVVAHHVSVMGVQAGAARHVLDANPGAAREALASIEESSRAAVHEMRQLLGVLRDDHRGTDPGTDDRLPSPGVEGLPELVDRLGHPGLTTTFAEVGDPLPLPRGMSVSLYRVAQEALTNTVRHANARRVDVRLRWLESAVEVEIVDDGRGTGATTGSGLGLVGMRERVSLHEGVFDAGPRPLGGFRVRARLALTPAARAVNLAARP